MFPGNDVDNTLLVLTEMAEYLLTEGDLKNADDNYKTETPLITSEYSSYVDDVERSLKNGFLLLNGDWSYDIVSDVDCRSVLIDIPTIKKGILK